MPPHGGMTVHFWKHWRAGVPIHHVLMELAILADAASIGSMLLRSFSLHWGYVVVGAPQYQS